MDLSEWIALGELIVAVIGIVVGCIGGKELQEANKLKIQIGELNAKIEKIEVNNSQMANTINNNGLGYRDTKELAEEIVEKKTKNKPDIFLSKEEPKDFKAGDIWMQIE